LFFRHRFSHFFGGAFEARLAAFPPLAARAAPAAICCFFDLLACCLLALAKAIGRRILSVRFSQRPRETWAS
jgi:hypothetical protein